MASARGSQRRSFSGPRHIDAGAPAGELAECGVRLVAGRAEVQLRGHDIGPDLFRASLSFRGREPRIDVDRERGRVAIDLPHPLWGALLFQPYAERAVVVLNSRLRWSVDITADALGGRVDLSRTPLRDVAIACDSGEVELDLPATDEPVAVRLSSTRVRAVLTVPGGVPVQFSSETGTWHVELPEHDGERVAHPGQRVVSLVEHEPGRGRFDVVLAGSGRLRLERR